MSDDWVSDLDINDEGVRAIMLGLAVECREAYLAGGISGETIELELHLDLGELTDQFRDLIFFSPVPAFGASVLGGLSVRFCPLAYRRLAEAAKDQVRRAVDRNAGGVIVVHSNPLIPNPSSLGG